jgi:TetR/AcrR family transcriptional regulator, fatty acid metabolism regulator protein
MTLEISNRQLEIIEAAGKILTNAGVNGLTIKNLAKEMKFSESAIYRHFNSKEEIIIALLHYLAESMDFRYTEVIKKGNSAKENFHHIFKNQFEFFHANPHFVVAVFSDGLMEESQLINQAIHKIMKVKMTHLLPIIVQGQAEGTFTNVINEEQIAHIVMGAVRLQMFKWRSSNFEFDIIQSGNEILNALLAILETKIK